MNLELTDTMPFGKFKGSKVEEVFKQDAGYLVWLRETRKKDNGDEKFFSREVNALLDMEIRDSKQLQKKYKPWDLPVITAPVDATPKQEEPASETAYQGTWGVF